jgi:hypothetical protein
MKANLDFAAAAERFPPSFDNSPFFYAFALFSLSLITSISLGVVIGHALEARRAREVDRLIGNPLPRVKVSALSPVSIHRLIVSGFLLTIIFEALPNVLVMLAWGEASDATMRSLFDIDRACDGMALLPFMASILVSLRAAPVVDHRLAVEPLRIQLRPTWGMIRDKLKITGLVLFISAGVTFYKSAGLP